MPRKKQRRAWGSVTEVKRGKKYVLRWPDHAKRCGRATETFYGTYREACERLAVIQASGAQSGRSMTFGHAHDKLWIPDIEKRLESGDLKSKTATSYESAWKNSVMPRWASVPIDSARAIDIQEWLDGLTKGSAEVALVVARQIVDLAVMYEAVDVNKFRGSYRMPKSGTERTKAILTPKEAAAVASRLAGSRMEAPFVLMCFGSCRVAESLAVKVDEVQFDETDAGLFAIVTVHRQAAKSGAVPRAVDDMKNVQSSRITIVPPPYGARLKEIAAHRKADESVWMTDRGDGAPFSINNATPAWAAAWETYGIEGKWVTMQNLRATWRTMAEVEWGIPNRLCELLMGHKLDGVSGKHYIRPAERDLIDKFEEAFCAKTRELRTI